MKTKILFDSIAEVDEKDARENLLENGYEESEITDNMICQEICDLTWSYFDDIKAELSRFFDGEYVIFFGNCKRWDGTYSAGKIGEFDDLFSKLRFDDICIYEENGHLFISTYDHDGGSTYEVKIVTDNGYNYYGKWNENWNDKRSEEEVHIAMINSSKYTHVPYFGKKVYG